MKALKYLSVLLVMLAMSATFFSCDRDNDITAPAVVDPNAEVNGKTMYWIDFNISNPGSLSQAAQDRFVELRDTVIYGSKGIKVIEHPMYVTRDYATKNFNAVANVPASESDIVQKIMIPTAKIQKVRDFAVTMTLSKDSMRTTLATYTWEAANVISADDLN